ncbi:DNA methyltransferase, partial [Escherichia coli]|nr:DNA methyltransferase [Escherichia coli]
EYGSYHELADYFTDAERKTDVEVALVKLQKPGNSYDSEFEGFFLEDDPAEASSNGIISYNVVRDIVNRYVA